MLFACFNIVPIPEILKHNGSTHCFLTDYIRLYYITFLSHCNAGTGSSGRFPMGKRVAIARRYPAFFFHSCVQCFRVSIPSAARPTLLRQMDIGSLTCEQLWVRDADTKGSQTHTCPHKGSNPGSFDLKPDAVTTDLRPPSSIHCIQTLIGSYYHSCGGPMFDLGSAQCFIF